MAYYLSQVLKLEAQCILDAVKKLESCELVHMNQLKEIYAELMENGGQLIFCGVGKSGIVALKCAATFTSLGMPSWFLHPIEALHGDLGRVQKNDAIVLISKSGTTEEILKLLPFLSIQKRKIIGLLGSVNSPIAEACGLVLDCSVSKEACINNQAPTTSTTLALAMGDAMAVYFESVVGLSREGFAINHPGGILGKSLRMKVEDLMLPASMCPVLESHQTLKDVILKMTQFPVGGCAVIDSGRFIGILVEGDIRRTFAKNDLGLETPVSMIVNKTPITIEAKELAFEALKKMERKEKELSLLPVVERDQFLGFIRLHDLLKEGFSLTK